MATRSRGKTTKPQDAEAAAAPAIDTILTPPPQTVADDVRRMSEHLEMLPTRQLGRNLLVGTWNIREFGDISDKWQTKPADRPIRDVHATRLIAEIVSRFDVIALQEVLGNLKGLRHVLKWLGDEWSFILTDATRGSEGGGERMAFLFDTRRVRLSGLAGELVVPPEELEKARASKDPDALRGQFARTPYAVAFRSYGITFVLIAVHVLYGKKAEERRPEILAVARWLKSMSEELHGYGQNLIVLGDFNIDRKGDSNYEALVSTGLGTPPELDSVARTISAEGEAGTFYDQIAWFQDDLSTLRYTGRAGRVNFKAADVLGGVEEDQYSFRLSDHYPIWTEFAVSDLNPR